MMVFTSGHTIFLGCVDTRTLMNDSMSLQVITKSRIEEISSIIYFEDLDICFELILDHGMKVLEYLTSLEFVFHQENPT